MTDVLLIDPKYPHNVGQVLRAASCFGLSTVWMTGERVALEGDGKRYRLPREERMRGVYDAEIKHSTRPFDETRELTPIAVEITPGAQTLPYFDHPENALYVFGPEDGSLGRATLGQCHLFVQLPMLHCANLAAAVYITLYDRHAKRLLMGLDESLVNRR